MCATLSIYEPCPRILRSYDDDICPFLQIYHCTRTVMVRSANRRDLMLVDI